MTTELVFEDTSQDGCHDVALRGELDMATAPQLEAAVDALCAAGAREIVLDLSELSFVDGAGVRAIMAARARCAEHECAFMVIHPRDLVERLFALTGLLASVPFRGRRRRDAGERDAGVRPASAT
jgi:anti-anti-sigma factor